MNQALEMARVAYQALDEKKGEDIRVIDISGISVIGDYFVITNGTNDSQVRALVDNVEEKMHKAGYELKEQEGNNSGTWVLLDYGDIIIHIFSIVTHRISFSHPAFTPLLCSYWNPGIFIIKTV